MASRKPAVSTQLKTAQAMIAALEKKVKEQESTQGWTRAAKETAEREVNDMNAFIDALPGAIALKAEDGYTTRTIVTRMGAWLATRPR